MRRDQVIQAAITTLEESVEEHSQTAQSDEMRRRRISISESSHSYIGHICYFPNQVLVASQQLLFLDKIGALRSNC